MAITYIGASAALAAGASATTTTFANAYTAATSGSDRKLVVVFGTKEDTPSITSVTYNGIALTPATSASQASTTPDTQIYMYYLDHADMPTDGAAHDLVIDTFPDAANPLALILEYAGVAQGAPAQTDTDLPAGSAVGTCSFTGVVDGSLLVAGATNAAATAAFTAGGGLVEVLEPDQASSPVFNCAMAHIVGTTGATIDATLDPSGTSASAMCAALWLAAAGAAAVGMTHPPGGRRFQHMLVR
jgi:hypothetical protein